MDNAISECQILRVEDFTPHGFSWISLKRIHYSDHAGRPFVYEGIQRQTRGARACDGVAILAKVTSEKHPTRVLVISQFRPAVGAFVLELPAGLLDADETCEQAAVRELREETGYEGVAVATSRVMYSDSGISNSCSRLVVVQVDGDAAQNAHPLPHPEPGEVVERHLLPMDGLLKAIYQLQTERGFELCAKLYAFATGIEMGQTASLALGPPASSIASTSAPATSAAASSAPPAASSPPASKGRGRVARRERGSVSDDSVEDLDLLREMRLEPTAGMAGMRTRQGRTQENDEDAAWASKEEHALLQAMLKLAATEGGFEEMAEMAACFEFEMDDMGRYDDDDDDNDGDGDEWYDDAADPVYAAYLARKKRPPQCVVVVEGEEEEAVFGSTLLGTLLSDPTVLGSVLVVCSAIAALGLLSARARLSS